MESCPRCLKQEDMCVCASIKPLPTRLQVLILQHPQEPDKDLGSARISHLALPSSQLRIGLSWPNLKKALGKEANSANWAVLYLGSGVKGPRKSTSPLQFVSKKGEPVRSPSSNEIEGVIILDGTWSQAKALWWRNAWLLKLKRAILFPAQKSLYQELRREPRSECLSTIESISEVLSALGEPKESSDTLRDLFKELLTKKRAKLKLKKA